LKNLYVVAHTQSEHHVERRVGGWYDTGLTDLGRSQAKRIARSLRELVPEHATVELFSSDLKRAHQTAEAISQLFGVPVEATADLREKSYGEAEGKPQAWLDERLVHAPKNGDRMDHDEGIRGAETRRQLAERIYRVVDRILASACEHQIVVTHGGPVTFVVAAWIGMPIDAAGHIAVKSTSGGITHLQQDDIFRNRRIMSLNETSHLLDIEAEAGRV
jgi:probable phosphoglycerate mutase